MDSINPSSVRVNYKGQFIPQVDEFLHKRYFLEKRKLENLREVSLGKESSDSVKKSNSQVKSVEQPKPIDRQTQKQIAKIESKIDKTEKEIAEVELKMAKVTDFSSKEYSDLQIRYHQLNEHIDQLMEQWEEISE